MRSGGDYGVRGWRWERVEGCGAYLKYRSSSSLPLTSVSVELLCSPPALGAPCSRLAGPSATGGGGSECEERRTREKRKLAWGERGAGSEARGVVRSNLGE